LTPGPGNSRRNFRGAATRAVADAIPGARYVTVEGQDHSVLHQPEALLPLLARFYA
jgi:hypothetical protein